MKMRHHQDCYGEYQTVQSPHNAWPSPVQWLGSSLRPIERASVSANYVNRRIGLLIGTTIAAALIAACQPRVSPGTVPTTPAPDPGGTTTPAPDGGTTTPAPDPVGSCVTRPGCALSQIEGPSSDPLQGQLGCGPAFRYQSGATFGFHGGVGSFCPDSPGNRAILHQRLKIGYLPGYCDSCLKVPPGTLFVFWTAGGPPTGPSCPSGCAPTPGRF
jgi:hypothetical protein